MDSALLLLKMNLQNQSAPEFTLGAQHFDGLGHANQRFPPPGDGLHRRGAVLLEPLNYGLTGHGAGQPSVLGALPCLVPGLLFAGLAA